MISLREVQPSDIGEFFEFMQDTDSLWQAAFTSKEPANRVSHDEHWQKILHDPNNLNRTICLDGIVVGSIARYFMDDIAQITYWISTEYKRRGIATEALKLFLQEEQSRPIEARTAFDNVASARVLAKNGFIEVGKDVYFANARGMDILEIIWRLE